MFGRNDYFAAYALMTAWLWWLLSSPVTAKTGGIVVIGCVLFILTIAATLRLNAPLPRNVKATGAIVTSAVMLTSWLMLVSFLPINHMAVRGFPQPIQFLYWLYPTIVGTILWILIFFYPLRRLFGAHGLWCVWFVMLFKLIFSLSALLAKNKLWIVNLVIIVETVSPLFMWVIADRLYRRFSDQSVLQRQVVE